jgi:hypothetical protein
MTTTILFQKDNFSFIKQNQHNFSLTFILENNQINLYELINFGFIKLIYQLNSDIIELFDLTYIDENTVIASILLKPFFQDIGISQKYLHLKISKCVPQIGLIQFTSESITNEKLSLSLSPDCELININNFVINCLTCDNKLNVEISIILDDTIIIPNVVETIIGPICYKMFKRIKQFIDNLSI